MKISVNLIRINEHRGIPEFRFPNSEFRMGYGDFGIPHHKLGDRGGDPETDFGMIEGVGHGMSYHGVLCK